MNRLIVSIGTAALLCACVTDNKETKDYTAYVNPFIGTGGHGHTFPGAVVPFGMIQPSPDTRIDGSTSLGGTNQSHGTSFQEECPPQANSFAWHSAV